MSINSRTHFAASTAEHPEPSNAGASSTNASRVGERLLEGIAGRVLVDSDQARYTVSFLVLSAYKASRTFRSDQRNVEVVARLDLIVMDCKPMGEQQKRAVVDIVDDRVVQRFLYHVGR